MKDAIRLVSYLKIMSRQNGRRIADFRFEIAYLIKVAGAMVRYFERAALFLVVASMPEINFRLKAKTR